jgi:two-component system, NarL family, response regulator LiaR
MKDSNAIKILIADGHVVVANGIAKVLEEVADFDVVEVSGSGEETIRLFEKCSPDVVTIDIDLPGAIGGLEVIRRLHHQSRHARILILTNILDPAMIHDALRDGVLSYLLKNSSTDELVRAVRYTYKGIPALSPEVTQILVEEATAPRASPLTSREQDVLALLANGLNNQQIADQLAISLSTVQFHVSNILNKLGVHNRLEAATFAVRHNLVV